MYNEKIQLFITDNSNIEEKLQQKLHVSWFCFFVKYKRFS